MPTFRHGRATALLVGAGDVAQYFRTATMSRSVDLAETSTFGTFDKTFVVGMRDGTLSLGGLFDGTANAIDQQLEAVLGVDPPVVVTYGPEGLAFGRRTELMNSEETAYEVSSPYNDVVSTSADFHATGGIFAGNSLHDLTPAETVGGNSASIDNGALTSAGLVATLHVPTNTRNGATVVKVQHSPDNSAWSDLVTFTSVGSTTTTAELLSTTGTVNRYLRALWTIAGSTGSVSFHVSAARKIN